MKYQVKDKVGANNFCLSEGYTIRIKLVNELLKISFSELLSLLTNCQ